ncbi:MAG: FHA domain-containing protein [Vulcanimicrobiota bacterium]
MAWSSGLQLRVIDGQRERRDRVIRLDGKDLTLGRASQGQRPGPGELLFKEPTVSRNHAVLTWKPLKGGFQLIHKSKTNPTLVNGKPTKKILLAPGDRVQMGLLILELEDAPGGRTPSSSRSGRASMNEPIMEVLTKVEREHEEEQRRHRAEREEKQRQREILASPEKSVPASPVSPRRSSRLDDALKSAPYDPQEESRKRRRNSGFGWQPPEEREPSMKDSGTELFKKPAPESSYEWSAPTQAPIQPEVSYQEPMERRTIPITEHPEPKPQPEMTGSPVYELVVAKGPDQGKNFPLKDMVMVLGQKQGDSDERDAQGVLLNDATLPSEIGMFVWQGREGAYGLLASENSMQIIEVERLEHGQRRRIRVDSHSSILLRVADEIQVGLTTLRVQKIGEPIPSVQHAPSSPTLEPELSPTPPPGRPTPLRSRPDVSFDAPPPPLRPAGPPRTEEDPVTSEVPSKDVPIWAQGTIGPGGQQQQAPPPAAPPPRPTPKGAGKDQAGGLEWGSRPNVDFLLEFLAGPMRGCLISLTPTEMERIGRLNAGAPGGRNNQVSLEGPDITNEAFHLVMEDGRFSLCNESISGLLIINRTPMKTGDRVVLMTGDVITIGTTKIRFLEREVVQVLSRYGLLAESGVTSDQDKIFPLTRQRLLIGRGKACDVRLSDLEVSRVHLGLAYGDGQFSVQHRSETNPTFLNGLSLLPGTVRKIKEGDRIRLSSLTVLRLVRR